MVYFHLFLGLPLFLLPTIFNSFECHLPFLSCKHGQTTPIFFSSSNIKLALRYLFVLLIHSFDAQASLSVDSSAVSGFAYIHFNLFFTASILM